jgi:hypothetical protein
MPRRCCTSDRPKRFAQGHTHTSLGTPRFNAPVAGPISGDTFWRPSITANVSFLQPSSSEHGIGLCAYLGRIPTGFFPTWSHDLPCELLGHVSASGTPCAEHTVLLPPALRRILFLLPGNELQATCQIICQEASRQEVSIAKQRRILLLFLAEADQNPQVGARGCHLRSGTIGPEGDGRF